MIDIFEKIYDKYYNLIYKLSYSYVLNRMEAEDIVQKTFYKLLINKNIMCKDHDEIKKWLIKVSINEAKDYLKSYYFKNNKKIEENTEIENNSFNYEVINALKNVNKTYRIPLYLYYYEGYSIREIADILHKNESAIKMRLKRGKEELRKELE